MFVTIGQAPRDDLVPELLSLSGIEPGDARSHQAGALDGVPSEEILAQAPAPREGRLYTRCADGAHVVVGAGFVARRLGPLLARLDGAGYDLIILISTGIFQPFALATPFLHGQQLVDAWIAALMMGPCELGLVYPLGQQHRAFAHGTLIQNATAVGASGEAGRLDDAAAHLAKAQLILMHSVGYDEAMAARMGAQTGKPVVTARRIIASALRLHLANAANRIAPPRAELVPLTGRLPEGRPQSLGPGPHRRGLCDGRLDDGANPLTPRERDVLSALLDGEGNKAIGRRLGISHRTVEIHRARVLAKLNAASPAELIRRAFIAGG